MMEKLIAQLGRRLFPTSEKTGWKCSRADVPGICDERSQPSPAQSEAARASLHHCEKNFLPENQLLMIRKNKQTNKQKHLPLTLAAA